MVHWKLWMFPFSDSLKIESYHSYLRGILTTSPILSGAGGFFVRIINLFPMAWMCIIWLNMHIFSWILVLIISLSLQDVITCTLLQFTYSWWLDMDYKNCWNVVVSFLKMSLSLRAVMTWTLLHFPVSCWIDMASKKCWTVFGYFLPMIRIQTLFLFLSGNAWFHGLLFFDWEIYYMFWCSQYFATMPIGVPLGGKFTLTSNIPYLMEGWSERSIFNVVKV